MVQLVGVDDGPDRLHPAVGDVEGEDVDHAAFAIVGDPAGLAVHPGRLDADAHLRGPPVQPEHEPGHVLGPGQRPGGRPGLAAAVAHHDHVRREQIQQGGHVAALGGGEEPAGHLVTLLAGGIEARFALVDVMAGAGEDLTAVRLGLAGDARDLPVLVTEHLVQQEHRAFGRRQALQQHQERHRQRVGHLGALGRIRFGPRTSRSAGEERLGQPGAHVGFPSHPGGPQVADGQPGSGGGQVGLGRVDAGAVAQDPGQPQEGLLDDVLGVADAPGLGEDSGAGPCRLKQCRLKITRSSGR